MVIRKIVAFISLQLCLIAFGQESNSCLKFYYQYSLQSDSLDIASKKDYIFVLMKKNDSTLFTELQNIKADSMEQSIWADYTKTKSSVISFKGVPHAKFKYYISKDLSKHGNEIKVYDKIGSGNFMYSEASGFKWELLNDKRQIAGFTCQKAVTSAFGRNFIAWFTTEIPFHDGPYKFRGLPGLILEVYDENKYFVFSMIKYQKDDTNGYVTLPKLRLRKLIVTTKDKFLNAKKNHREGIIGRIRTGPFSESVSNERIKQIQENLERNNNQIEKVDI